MVAFQKIDIDDEVFAYLEREAMPFTETTPNDVLRRLLLGGAPKPSKAKMSGLLMPLIDAGRLKPGDRLMHRQPRKRRTFYAEVTEDGFVQTEDGRRFAKPSPALKECVGHDINGWDNWIVERLGDRLTDLR